MADDFLTQLRQRRTLRVAGAYIAGAFVILQGADLLVAAFEGPPRLLQSLVLLAALGFPVTLYLGWSLRWNGKRLEWETTRASRRQHLLFAGLVVIATSAVGFTSWSVWLRESGAGIDASHRAALDPRRVAVLYLDDLSRDGMNDFLADGLSEGLIHELSQIEGLEVVSRNGVKPFRGQDVPLDSVVAALGAGSIVEGSIQRSGDRVRVTVQLIDGATQAHVGSTTLDRPISDLFALQDELLEEVGGFLRAELGTQIRLEARRRRTRSVEAWAMYHRASRLRDEAVAMLASDVSVAAGFFSDATRLAADAERADPEWSAPIVLQGRLAYDESRGTFTVDGERTAALVRTAIEQFDRAVAVDSLDAEARELRGTARYWGYLLGLTFEETIESALARAAADLRAAIELDPGMAGAWATLSHYFANTATPRAAYDAALRAYEADAFVENAPTVLWRLYSFAYDLAEAESAERWCREGRRRFPHDSRFHECRLWQLTLPGVTPDADAAWDGYRSFARQLSGARAEGDSLRGLAAVGIVLARAGLADSARTVLEQVVVEWDDPIKADNAVWLAYGYVQLGEYGRAAELVSAFLARTPGAEDTFFDGWWFESALEHPAFRRLTRRLDTTDG